MKILTIFCDMVRSNLMGLYNTDIDKNPFDLALEKIGGTLFTNCYTPTPDTGRSLACFWTGEGPAVNGCNKRIKYPGYYLSKPSFLDMLREEGYDLNFFMPPKDVAIGELPPGYENIGRHSKDLPLKKFLSELSVSQNSYTFLSLPDFHWGIDDYRSSKKSVKEGFRILAESIGIIDDILDVNTFDHVIVFSDHGCKLHTEVQSQEKYKRLNRDRTNVLMLIKSKSDNTLFINEKLCSVVDIYPTIYDLLNIPCPKQGISLFDEKEHLYIVAEDHSSFYSEVDQKLELWAVINKNGIYFRELTQYHFENELAFTETPQQLDKLIMQDSSCFANCCQESESLRLYINSASKERDYNNGEKRYYSFQTALYAYIRKVLLKLKIYKWALKFFRNIQ